MSWLWLSLIWLIHLSDRFVEKFEAEFEKWSSKRGRNEP